MKNDRVPHVEIETAPCNTTSIVTAGTTHSSTCCSRVRWTLFTINNNFNNQHSDLIDNFSISNCMLSINTKRAINFSRT
jgi:hypothetical protein